MVGMQVDEGAWLASGCCLPLYNLPQPIMGPRPQHPDPRDPEVTSWSIGHHPYLYTDAEHMELA